MIDNKLQIISITNKYQIILLAGSIMVHVFIMSQGSAVCPVFMSCPLLEPSPYRGGELCVSL